MVLEVRMEMKRKTLARKKKQNFNYSSLFMGNDNLVPQLKLILIKFLSQYITGEKYATTAQGFLSINIQQFL